MQEYKVYGKVKQMFDLDFMNNLRQAHGDNPWPTELMNYNYKTCVLCQEKYLLGMNHLEHYALIKASQNKWPKNVSDLEDDEYESLALKYDANKDALIAKKERNIVEEEPKTKTLSTLEFEDGKDLENTAQKNLVGHAIESLLNHGIERR